MVHFYAAQVAHFYAVVDMLKRHLKTAHGMTPDDYRKRWGMPLDDPLVEPSYADTRSKLANKIGLGRKPGTKMKARRKA